MSIVLNVCNLQVLFETYSGGTISFDDLCTEIVGGNDGGVFFGGVCVVPAVIRVAEILVTSIDLTSTLLKLTNISRFSCAIRHFTRAPNTSAL